MGAFGPVMVENKETGEKEVLEKEVNTVKFKQSEEVDGTLITGFFISLLPNTAADA